MADYHDFTSARVTEPDASSLLTSLRALDPTAGVQHMPGLPTWKIKKATVWTANQITAAQNALDTAPASTPQLTAQATIDAWPIETRAMALALIDQINVLRRALPVPLADITPAQTLAAVRTKAGTL